MTLAAILFVIIIVVVILFQIALILGAPWGEYTLGGKYPGKLPRKMRIAVVFQIAVLFLFIGIILTKAGLIEHSYPKLGDVGIWFVLIFFVLGTILNLATPSKKERMVWGPVNIIALMLTLILALG